jgi:ZIP family zinc transporter
MKDEMSDRVQKTLLGFASGVMVAASVWSLLIPAMEMEESKGAWSVLPAAVGFLLGMGFLLVLDELTPHPLSSSLGFLFLFDSGKEQGSEKETA